MKNRGITRVDLIVTLVCAAFLIVMLGAVGNRGRGRAQQLVCASQLAKWGQAVIMHSADNGDEVMSMVRRWWVEPYPHYIGAVPDDYDYPWLINDFWVKSEWSLFAINPYIGCVGENFHEDGIATNMVACPATDSDFIIDWAYANWDAFCGPDGSIFFIEPSYSYWGRADLLDTGSGECSPGVYSDLTGNTFSASRLVMSDVMTIDGGSPYYRYNHGARGWCWNMFWEPDVGYPSGHVRADGEQDAIGRNQLFGDGRVEWKPISLEFEDNLPSERFELGGVGYLENEWNGPGSGWVNQWDTSYY